MTAPTFDLEPYLARIAYRGPRSPTLETLSALQEAHAQAIPFENVDVLLGRPIHLDLPSIEKKLIRDRRGGYCFEHNTLFAAALRELGFTVTPLLARVRWLAPTTAATPQTHMALRVDIAGRPWLADTGFGGAGLLNPIALDTTEVQTTRHESRRLLPHGRNLLQQVRLGETWSDVYVLHLDEAFPVDFEVANWFTSTHPASRFRNNLLVARADGTRRYSIFNREFTTRDLQGAVEKRSLASWEELRAVLADTFGIALAGDIRLDCPALDWA